MLAVSWWQVRRNGPALGRSLSTAVLPHRCVSIC
jgi:hypothetical protein